MSSPNRHKLIPMIVAAPMFLQNIDMLAAVVALPDMARSLRVNPLHLNLVIAAYAISLAVFLPLSSWLVERFGAKRMFCTAIILFAAASALCGTATSATMLVCFRVVQGFGAALMVPVGRLILLRSVPQSEMLAAMVWYTIPPAIGRLTGPLVGGLIVSVSSWRGIFLVNLPLGAIALLLALIFLEKDEPSTVRKSFDFTGFVLMGLGLGATLGGLELAGRGLVSPWYAAAMVLAGLSLLAVYVKRSLGLADPVIDLAILRIRTFRTNVIGAFPLRLAVSASPFLMPLMLQLGFGFSPLDAGAVASGTAVGALCTRLVMRQAMTFISFRTLFLFAASGAALFLAGYGLLPATTPQWAIFTVLVLGGILTSLCLVSLNTVGFVDVPADRRSHATALVAMAQQVTTALGVVIAASLLAFFLRARGGDGVTPIPADFTAAFFVIAVLAATSLFSFARLPPDAGADLRQPSEAK